MDAQRDEFEQTPDSASAQNDPETCVGGVHDKLANNRPYPIYPDVLHAQGSAAIQSAFGGRSHVSMAIPEGSSAHPAHTVGHATGAGVCVTILKALFYTDPPIANQVVVRSDGLTLAPDTGTDAQIMTVGGEWNELAMNVACGRNSAGVHRRSTDSFQAVAEFNFRRRPSVL